MPANATPVVKLLCQTVCLPQEEVMLLTNHVVGRYTNQNLVQHAGEDEDDDLSKLWRVTSTDQRDVQMPFHEL